MLNCHFFFLGFFAEVAASDVCIEADAAAAGGVDKSIDADRAASVSKGGGCIALPAAAIGDFAVAAAAGGVGNFLLWVSGFSFGCSFSFNSAAGRIFSAVGLVCFFAPFAAFQF